MIATNDHLFNMKKQQFHQIAPECLALINVSENNWISCAVHSIHHFFSVDYYAKPRWIWTSAENPKIPAMLIEVLQTKELYVAWREKKCIAAP